MTLQKSLMYLLLSIFFGSGTAKLLSLPFEIAAFSRWGYPQELMYFIGAFEVIGALGLLLPITRRTANWGLSTTMLGACITHIVHAEYGMLVIAFALLSALFTLQYQTKNHSHKKMVSMTN
ncbi:MAG: DoxX family protein [Plesiomonas sp.]